MSSPFVTFVYVHGAGYPDGGISKLPRVCINFTRAYGTCTRQFVRSVRRARNRVGCVFVSELVTIGEETAEIGDYTGPITGWSSGWFDWAWGMRKEVNPVGTFKAKPLVGQKIVAVRAMTAADMERQDWHQDSLGMAPVVIVVEDGTKLFPSKDDDGNGYGCLFGETRQGKGFYVTPEGK